MTIQCEFSKSMYVNISRKESKASLNRWWTNAKSIRGLNGVMVDISCLISEKDLNFSRIQARLEFKHI